MKMWTLGIQLAADEQGQSLVEYAFVGAFISLLVFGILVLLGPHLATIFRTVDSRLVGAKL